MNYTNDNNQFDTSYAKEINEFPFTISQVGCMCEVLIQSNQFISLRHLLNRIPKTWLVSEENFLFYYHRQQQQQQFNTQLEILTNEKLYELRELIIKSFIILSYNDHNYKLVYELIKYNHFFNKKHQIILQHIWYNIHYDIIEKLRQRSLTAVDKYRIRKKYPLPNTIWDGEKIFYYFKQNIRYLLINYYQYNKYPNSIEKYEISRKTGLTLTQVSNWFKNHRQRDKSLESTDLYIKNKNKTLLNNNYNCNWSWQSIKSNTNNSNNNNSDNNPIIQHTQGIKNEYSIETYGKCYNYQSSYQQLTNQQTLSDNNSIDQNLSSSIENPKDSEYYRTTISYPIYSHQYVTLSKNSNELWFTQWSTNHFNSEYDKYNYEGNYNTISFDHNQNHSYYTL
ncbi:unnamed protein product [Schistosoma rodhaini]|nr:unnamed protein product [Schistosoma rodhaini]